LRELMSAEPLPEGWKSVRLIIQGRVQGVSYRYWTVTEATARGLDGWVRNRRDGNVEVFVTGPAATVDEMIEACRQGPRASRVTDIEIHNETTRAERGFRQLPTA
jgi:acylphosphatase